MQHSFDVQEAVNYGLEEAIMIWNLRFWIIKNKANKKHSYLGEDGILRTWTYNTNEAFQKLFPYWKKGAIERNLTRMIDKGILVKGNFNATKYDRTAWYAFSDEDRFLSSSLIIAHFSDSGNANPEIGNSKSRNEEIEISDSGNIKETDIKTDIKSFFSLPSESKKEKLKILFKEKNYKSDPEKYFLFREKSNWSGVKNLEADIAWWENGFKEKNPDKYRETKSEAIEIKNIRFDIRRAVEIDLVYNMNFAACPIEKTDSGYKIIVSSKEALKYEEALKKINVKIEVK